jgi:hypothetical protein
MSVQVRKKREEVEQKYISEFIAKFYPNPVRVMLQVPMGDTPHSHAKGRADVTAKWFWRYGPRADAIVIMPDKLVLIEAETRRPVVGLSELDVYSREIDRSPHLFPYNKLPKEIVLVSPIFDRHVAEVCEAKGFKYVIFHPDWIDEHLKRWGVIPE